MQGALGLLEVKGLAAALEAADAAVKAANVTVVGLEPTKGSGLVVLKLQGEVGAIRAAVEAAAAAAGRLTSVFASQVIARPHEEIAPLAQG